MIANIITYRKSLLDGELFVLTYICKSPLLAQFAKEEWEMLPSAQDTPANIQVQFTTIKDLVLQQTPIKEEDFVSFDYFINWYNSNKKRLSVDGYDPRELYRQFRVGSGYTLDEYLTLGIRQCTISERDERIKIHTAYKAYLNYLMDSNKTDLDLCKLNLPACDVVLCDEAQDQSFGTLRALYDMAKDHQIAFLGDTHQDLLGHQSFRPFILALLNPIRSNAYIDLSGTYRCPDKISQVANTIIKMKYGCTGGPADKFESPEIISKIEGESGQFFIMNHQEALSSHQLQQAIRQADTAVVTSEDNYSSACELFPAYRVFTYFQIKGLGYRTIILFHPFAAPYFAQLQKKLNSLDMGKAKVNRPKNKVLPLGDHAIDDAVRCNELVTAVTRAKHTLYVISDDNTMTRFYLDSLRRISSEHSLIASQNPVETTTDGGLMK